MITMDDYFKADRHERAFIDSLKPPTVHTHRGVPRSFEMDGYHESTKPKREPTHYGEPRNEKPTPSQRAAHAIARWNARSRNG